MRLPMPDRRVDPLAGVRLELLAVLLHEDRVGRTELVANFAWRVVEAARNL